MICLRDLDSLVRFSKGFICQRFNEIVQKASPSLTTHFFSRFVPITKNESVLQI